MKLIDAINEKIESDVLAERERCAKIAENMVDRTSEYDMEANVADEIAAAIRSQPAPGPVCHACLHGEHDTGYSAAFVAVVKCLCHCHVQGGGKG